MRQVKGSLMVETTGQGLYEITARVQAWVAAAGHPRRAC